jgi:drug/metabolite transporter (DMT)-like permease
MLTALASAALLSTTAIFIRWLTTEHALPALVLASWRNVLVVLTLLPVLALVRPADLRPGRRLLPVLGAQGLVLAAFNASWTLSVVRNGAALATVLVYSSAAFTVVLAWRLLGEELSLAKGGAVAGTLLGCALVSGALDVSAASIGGGGVLVGLSSGLFYALYSLLGRSASRRGASPWTAVLFTFAVAAAALLAVNLLGGGRIPGTAATPAGLLAPGISATGWGLLFLLAAGPTLGGFVLYNAALARLPAGTVNLVVTVEPVFTGALAWSLLGERWGALQVAGGALVVASVALLHLHEARGAAARRD